MKTKNWTTMLGLLFFIFQKKTRNTWAGHKHIYIHTCAQTKICTHTQTHKIFRSYGEHWAYQEDLRWTQSYTCTHTCIHIYMHTRAQTKPCTHTTFSGVTESIEHIKKTCPECMQDIDTKGIFSSKGKETVTVRAVLSAVCLSFCLSLCLYFCLSIFLSVYLCICLSIQSCLSTCLPVYVSMCLCLFF